MPRGTHGPMRLPGKVFAVVVLLVLGGAACHRGDAQQCEKACRNYARLVYWDKAEAEIAAVKTPAERKLVRERHVSKFTNDLESDIDVCTTQCQSADNDGQVACMIAAKKAVEAKACTE